MAAVAVPVLIHLLLRQRPRVRPWAAMRWLQAAAKIAERRYRLTNLLLLLLRCLAVVLIALAVARPTLVGMGSGERLVLVVDATASMGARGSDPGPLATAKAALLAAAPEVRSAALVVVAQQAQVLADGPLPQVLEALGRVEASEIPGGLDRLAETNNSAVLAQVIGPGADVLMVSDFQQDDGAQAVALCANRCRSVARWQVGAAAPNALLTSVAAVGDAEPGQPGEISLEVVGPLRGAAVAVDDGGFLGASVPAAGAAVLRLVTPPLAAGEHRIRVRIEDEGLVYDNLLELPLTVRPAVPVLVVQERQDYLGAAFAADPRLLISRAVRPAALTSEPLPDGGLVALRSPIVDGARLAAWVRRGGVVWARLPLLAEDANLRELLAGVAVTADTVTGGEFLSGDADCDEVLRLGRRERVLRATLPATASVLLRAGSAPLVALVPAGQGALVVELDDLAGDASFVARGTTPVWAGRVVRRVTSRLQAPARWQAGAPAPAAGTLERGGRSVPVAKGELLLLPPGLWRNGDSRVIVLPSREEGRIDRAVAPGTLTALDQALPRRPGRDWGLPLALAALMVVLLEGLLAAWAGRRYGG